MILLDVGIGGAVEDRELGAIDLNEAVVNAEGIERRHTVFDGRDAGVATLHHGAAVGLDHVLGDGVDDGLALHIDALYLIAVVLGCRIEGDGQTEARMQAFAEKRKAAAKGGLFFSIHSVWLFLLVAKFIDFFLQRVELLVNLG
jgi:hypothetical protein